MVCEVYVEFVRSVLCVVFDVWCAERVECMWNVSGVWFVYHVYIICVLFVL